MKTTLTATRKLLTISLACAAISLLSACSNNPATPTANSSNNYCKQLQQQMALDEANTQPSANSSLANQAMLMQRYRSYDCPALLDPDTSNSAKQQLITPPPLKHQH